GGRSQASHGSAGPRAGRKIGAAESRLERRAADLRSLAASDPALQHTDLRAGITTLTKLQDLGPAAPIFLPALGPAEPCDAWLRPPAAVAA
ncbi:hypothetical protein CLM81_25505, partial [Streptomyces albidoflavus]